MDKPKSDHKRLIDHVTGAARDVKVLFEACNQYPNGPPEKLKKDYEMAVWCLAALAVRLKKETQS
jgi:hypothetical protein